MSLMPTESASIRLRELIFSLIAAAIMSYL